MPKSAKERLNTKKDTKLVVLDKDFAGVKKGQKLFVATPKIVDEYIRAIPYGEHRSILELRADLAQHGKGDATCPVSTAIFIRISAQAAIDDMHEGIPVNKITPFWRLLSSEDKIAKKLTIDADWIDLQREVESCND